MDGICTLANDSVYDQAIALLNSIEAMEGSQVPICIYPYNDKMDRLAAEVERRPNVQIYSDRDSIARWDDFVRQVWEAHPTAEKKWVERGHGRNFRFGHHRLFCAFDGPFDRFVYMDADTLLMQPLDRVFAQLDRHDWIVYDFQYTDPSHVYDVNSAKLYDVFPKPRVETEIFCSGFYGAKRGLFPEPQRAELLESLRSGDVEILYIWSADQTLLNYMTMKVGLDIYNFALDLPKSERTGCSVTSPHFEQRDNVLYDGDERLTYIHYIGISSSVFKRVCEGENIDFPYRDLFLHYRYLHEPQQRPVFTAKPTPYDKPPSLMSRVLKKLNLVR